AVERELQPRRSIAERAPERTSVPASPSGRRIAPLALGALTLSAVAVVAVMQGSRWFGGQSSAAQEREQAAQVVEAITESKPAGTNAHAQPAAGKTRRADSPSKPAPATIRSKPAVTAPAAVPNPGPELARTAPPEAAPAPPPSAIETSRN